MCGYTSQEYCYWTVVIKYWFECVSKHFTKEVSFIIPLLQMFIPKEEGKSRKETCLWLQRNLRPEAGLDFQFSTCKSTT